MTTAATIPHQNPFPTSVKAKQLGKRFNREWIFKDLTFDFSFGNTYALSGPNGSGKSTLMQTLWGQLPPSFGELEYAHPGGAIPSEKVHTHLSIAAPYMDLIEEFTLYEHLRFHFSIKKTRDQQSLETLMDRMYLTPSRNKRLSDFSSGMRQRVKLALAFFTDASLIFLDEPGTNLDAQAFQWYRDELALLPGHCTVFIASNQPEEYPEKSVLVDLMAFKPGKKTKTK